MLKIENTEVMGWEHAIRGMRNPKRTLGRRVILIGDISLQLRGRIIFWLLTLMIVNFGLVRMMQI